MRLPRGSNRSGRRGRAVSASDRRDRSQRLARRRGLGHGGTVSLLLGLLGRGEPPRGDALRCDLLRRAGRAPTSPCGDVVEVHVSTKHVIAVGGSNRSCLNYCQLTGRGGNSGAGSAPSGHHDTAGDCLSVRSHCCLCFRVVAMKSAYCSMAEWEPRASTAFAHRLDLCVAPRRPRDPLSRGILHLMQIAHGTLHRQTSIPMPGRFPSSTSAFFNQVDKQPSEAPKSFAICFNGASRLRTTATTSSRNSAG